MYIKVENECISNPLNKFKIYLVFLRYIGNILV